MAVEGTNGAITDISSMLNALVGLDNALRKQAEGVYANMLQTKPVELVTQLMGVACNAASSVLHRSFSAVLLRRLFQSSSKVWPRLNLALHRQVMQALLAAVTSDRAAVVVRRLCHTIAEVAANTLESPGWPELMPTIFALIRGDKVEQRASGLFLLNKVAEYCCNVIGPYAAKAVDTLVVVLEDTDNEVRVEAMRATVSLLLSSQSDDDDSSFRAVWPKLLKVVEHTVTEDELAAREALSSLIDIAHLRPRFLREVLNATVQHMLVIAGHADMDNELRKLALEFLIVLSERAGSMARKCRLLIEQAVPLALALICDVEEDEQWDNGIETPLVFTGEDEGDDELSGAGEAAIDRIARSLGGGLVMPIVSAKVGPFFKSADWKQRRAALVTIGLLAEGCNQHMWASLPSTLPLVLSLVNDGHIRVRYAAVHALGQFALDFSQPMTEDDQNFQDVYGKQVLAALTTVCANVDMGKRVRGHACLSLCNLLNPQQCVPEVLGDPVNTQALLAALNSVLQTCRPGEQRHAMTAIACTAQVLGEGFIPFYDAFMPLAFAVLAAPAEKGNRDLRAQTIEAIGLVGSAVGAAKFAPDALKFVNALLAMKRAGFAADDPQARYVEQTCCLLSKTLGSAFLPFLPEIIPALVKMANVTPAVVLTDAVEGESEGIPGMDTLVVDIRGMGTKRLGMDTSSIENKATACQLLFEYLGNVGYPAMIPYLPEIAKSLISGTRYAYLAGVRQSSLAGLTRLMEVAVQHTADPSLANNLLNSMLENLGEGVSVDHDMDVMITAAEAFSEVLKMAYECPLPIGVQKELVKPVLTKLTFALKQCYMRTVERHQAFNEDADADEMAKAELDQKDEDEKEMLTSLVDAVGWMIKNHKATIYPQLVDIVMPQVSAFVAPTLPTMFQTAAICTLDDIVEHCAPHGEAVIPTFGPLLVKNIAHAVPDIRQAAVYGVGVCAQTGGAQFDAFVKTLGDGLVAVISSEEAYSDTYALSTDNAVSALYRLVKHRASLLSDANAAFMAVISRLPLTNDEMEAKYLHKEVLSLIVNGDARLVGSDASRAGHLLTLVGSIMLAHMRAVAEDEDEGLLDDESIVGLQAAVAFLKKRAGGAAAADAMLATLPSDLQLVLRNVWG